MGLTFMSTDAQLHNIKVKMVIYSCFDRLFRPKGNILFVFVWPDVQDLNGEKIERPIVFLIKV